MCNPKIIRIALKANFGITTFTPINAAIDIASIGPSIQARGIQRYSAIIALGIEIKITIKKFFEEQNKPNFTLLTNLFSINFYNVNDKS